MQLLSPKAQYQQNLQQDDFHFDKAQQQAVECLQQLYETLIQEYHRRSHPFLSFRRIKTLLGVYPEPCQGLYFWGGVGRGKTYLMDTFFDALPFDCKQRTHFHRFMQQVHQQLTALKGEKNPLEQVADRIAKNTLVLCFDEFFVTDIGDAMILAGLMQALFKRGVTLVATSNIEPEGLYKDGLQRERFIPAIRLIQRYTQVVNVDSGVDYRLRVLQQARLFHSPLNDQARNQIAQSFIKLVPDVAHIEENTFVSILGREIPCVKQAEDVAWFRFDALCEGPRSQNDYIELSRIYHAVIVEAVPILGENADDSARRFINLIDEFYDRAVKVIISAEAPIQNLYQGSGLNFEFERTKSRLLEMQSEEYLAREHRA